MKTIKLTTEQAKQLYAKDQTFRDTILHEFTDEELGIEPKPFTWYDLGQVQGAYIERGSKILDGNILSSFHDNRNTYPCKQDAEQALAKCMVLQLARHYNGCDQHEIKGGSYKFYYNNENGKIISFETIDSNDDQIKFIRIEDLQKCIKDNEELFKKMLGVNK